MATVQFIQTDFGDTVYDTWYLGAGRYNFEAPEFVRKHLPFYEAVLHLKKKSDNLLDTGCGIGSYSREFTRAGYKVVGLDMSPNFLSEAERITDSEGLDIRFLLGDYNAMDFEDEFSVVLFEGSFFYRSEAGLAALLKRIYRALRAGGRLYFVHPNPVLTNLRFPTSSWSEIAENVFVLEEGTYDADSDIERYRWLKIDLETQQHYRCDYLLKHLSVEALTDRLTEAGFKDVHLYKKRRVADFQPLTDETFSVVARKG